MNFSGKLLSTLEIFFPKFTGIRSITPKFQLPFDPLGQEEKISMLGPYEFRIGLLLYYSVPCTITAGIVLVAQAEGNLPMAGAVATVANIIGCYTTPILLKVFLSGGRDIHIQT